jgi:hypothetical protein
LVLDGDDRHAGRPCDAATAVSALDRAGDPAARCR